MAYAFNPFTGTFDDSGTFSGGTLTSKLTLAPGTTTNSPLTLQSGTNLTTAAPGTVEYDGNVIYTTPAGRGVSPSMMFYRLNSGLVGSNVTTAQSLFGVGVTLAGSTVYSFEYQFALSKSTGLTSHSNGLGFGGTATLNNILYGGLINSATTALPIYSASAAFFASNTAANTTASSSLGSSILTRFYTLFGTVSINAGGTFIPQYTLSAAPGGAFTTQAGSYFNIWPIGTAGSNTSVGPWA
jgi:hypothetical protein